jgi:hypothetical protein
MKHGCIISRRTMLITLALLAFAGAACAHPIVPEGTRPSRENGTALHHSRRLRRGQQRGRARKSRTGARIEQPFVMEADQDRRALNQVRGWLGQVQK